MLSKSPLVLSQFTQVGQVSTATGNAVEISGAGVRNLRAGERLIVRTVAGDYGILAGQWQRGRRMARTSPAAAGRVAPGDKVYRKTAHP